jgi:two-component system chemotaxis response regulator CheY
VDDSEFVRNYHSSGDYGGGRQCIRRVRADGKYSSLPIIIVFTESEGKDKMKGFEAGANLYLVKPSAPEMMVENIRMILAAS